MRFTLAMGLVALQGAGILSASLEAQCGKLGVMKLDKSTLPPNIDPDQVRLCDEHPTALEQGNVFERACYTAKLVGCSRGYCFRQCGTANSGQWCWTAAVFGYGRWLDCTKDNDCSVFDACGLGSNCGACGCSC